MSISNPARREALRCALAAGALGLGGLSASRVAAAPTDADGVNLDLHAGPAVWIEEHWDVKVETLPRFLAAYDDNVYALARQTPGYRGYTVLTSLPAGPGEQKENTRLGPAETLIRPHPAIRLQGDTLTGKSINWDALIGHAFNVLIIHHLQTWPDADAFRGRIADLHARANPGESLADHLARVLFPLANNYWDAEYRMVQTGWPATAPAAPRRPTDADGLNLEPREGPHVLVGEHWDVKPERFRQWLAAYETLVYSVIRRTSGYRGYSVATTLPPQAWEKGAQPMTAAALKRIGGEDALYAKRPGVMMDGAVRTDISINVGALYKKTFNVILMHEMANWTDLEGWFKRFSKIYADEHKGAVFTDAWAAQLMNNANNHWDTFFRVLKTSFTPGSQA